MFVTNLCRHGIRIRNEGYLCFVVGWFSSTPHPQWQPTKAKTLPLFLLHREKKGQERGKDGSHYRFGTEGRGADSINKVWSSGLLLFLSCKGSEVQPFVQWVERCSNAFSHVMQRRRLGWGIACIIETYHNHMFAWMHVFKDPTNKRSQCFKRSLSNCPWILCANSLLTILFTTSPDRKVPLDFRYSH
jgi:hypothetical protein